MRSHSKIVHFWENHILKISKFEFEKMTPFDCGTPQQFSNDVTHVMKT